MSNPIISLHLFTSTYICCIYPRLFIYADCHFQKPEPGRALKQRYKSQCTLSIVYFCTPRGSYTAKQYWNICQTCSLHDIPSKAILVR